MYAHRAPKLNSYKSDKIWCFEQQTWPKNPMLLFVEMVFAKFQMFSYLIVRHTRCISTIFIYVCMIYSIYSALFELCVYVI